MLGIGGNAVNLVIVIGVPDFIYFAGIQEILHFENLQFDVRFSAWAYILNRIATQPLRVE